MLTLAINEPELMSIELIRLALSETTTELRQTAITNVKHEVVAFRLQEINDTEGTGWMSEPKNADFVQWIAKTSAERHDATYELSQTTKRYDDRNERKLNVAEHIGKLIWHSIQDKRFEGVQTNEGLLKQVRYQATEFKISGAKDMDTLRGIWKTYRGVVHLGMAMDYCEKYPNQERNILFVADNYRLVLSKFCPKGTKTPYVPEDEQIMFYYYSNTWGPRFRNRGLPFSLG